MTIFLPCWIYGYIVEFGGTHFKVFDELYEYLENIDKLFK